MIVDVVDQRDRPVGAIRRSDLFRERLNFRVAHIFLFDNKGRLLVQKLPARHRRHPGSWGSSVATYVYRGETYAEAAARRLPEELGVREVDLHFFSKTSMKDKGCKKFIGLFIGACQGGFAPDPLHVEAVEFLPVERIHLMLETHEREFTPTFRHVLGFYLRARGA